MSTPADPKRLSLRELLAATRPWWILPLVIIVLAGVGLALLDIAPLRQMAYAVM